MIRRAAKVCCGEHLSLYMTPDSLLFRRGAGRLLVLLAVSGAVASLTAQDAPLTLPQAVARAIDQYPSVRAAAAQVAAAVANAALSRAVAAPPSRL